MSLEELKERVIIINKIIIDQREDALIFYPILPNNSLRKSLGISLENLHTDDEAYWVNLYLPKK